MNNGAFGENFPYTNFHDLNTDWIIKIAKDFLDQYTHIQEVIANGETSLQNLTTSGLEQLQEKADALEALLQQWYNTHSEDIANQLAEALADLENWYTTHEGYLDQYVQNSINAFNLAADAKAQQTIASIPSDYTTLSNNVTDLYNVIDDIADVHSLLSGRYFHAGQIKADGTVGTSNVRSYCEDFIQINTGKPLHIVCDSGYMYKLSYYNGASASAFVSETEYRTGSSLLSIQYPYFRLTYSTDPITSSPPDTHNISVISIKQYENSADDEIKMIEEAVGIVRKELLPGLAFGNGRVNRETGENATSNSYSFSDAFIQIDTSKTLYVECDTGYAGYLAPYTTNQLSGFSGPVIDFTASTPLVISNPAPFYRLTYATDPLSTAPSPTTNLEVVRMSQYVVEDENKIYTVSKTGGDFDKLTDALEYAKTHSDITLIVGNGEWDIVDELGSDFFTNYTSSSSKGCFLGNGLHIIFNPKATVVCNYTGSNASVNTLFSAFNAGSGDFTIEGLNISASNIRYCVHDDRSGDTANTYHKYINCNMTIDNRNNVNWDSTQCIGGGLAVSSNIEIVNCVFESLLVKEVNGLVTWHNSGIDNAKSRIIIKDNYFKGQGTIRISYYGPSTLMTDAIVCNNSLGSEIIFGGEGGATNVNVNLMAWNNPIRN